MSKLLLLDGHSLAYRAFYALPTDLATRTGTITNAVYGFTSMLIKMLGDEKPDYIAVAFDTGAPTFRDEMDAEYKAGRKETPDVFSSQLPLIHEVLEALAIPTVEVEGVEADDVIATLAERLEERKTIDRAKGVLMDQHGKTEQEAWRFLQQQAMHNRVKVHDVARRVVDGEVTP